MNFFDFLIHKNILKIFKQYDGALSFSALEKFSSENISGWMQVIEVPDIWDLVKKSFTKFVLLDRMMVICFEPFHSGAGGCSSAAKTNSPRYIVLYGQNIYGHLLFGNVN